jgi:hypothetical protein
MGEAILVLTGTNYCRTMYYKMPLPRRCLGKGLTGQQCIYYHQV